MKNDVLLLKHYSIWPAGCSFRFYQLLYKEHVSCVFGIGYTEMQHLIQIGYAKPIN